MVIVVVTATIEAYRISFARPLPYSTEPALGPAFAASRLVNLSRKAGRRLSLAQDDISSSDSFFAVYSNLAKQFKPDLRAASRHN